MDVLIYLFIWAMSFLLVMAGIAISANVKRRDDRAIYASFISAMMALMFFVFYIGHGQ